MVRTQQRQTGEAVHAGHVEVEQKGVDLGFVFKLGLHFAQRARHAYLRAGKRLAKGGGERIAHHRMVVGDKELLGARHASG